jgi:4-deoxy-L-threo-5-hexosulose-uronate ketol-isomerase
MEIRYESSPREVERMNTAELRENFLVEKVFEEDKVTVVYSHYERLIVGGVKPVNTAVSLPTYDALKSEYFLERREIGIINVGGKGKISVDGAEYSLDKLSCLYVGKGSKAVSFLSEDSAAPALFYLLSTPAHKEYPTTLFTKEQAFPMTIGAPETSNHRTVYKYIHKDGIDSCQLVMGLTILHTGSIWNTMPPHVHDRRAEIYLYFDVDAAHGVMHFMGKPDETRHMWVRNHQAIISPPWSIHSGAGSASYSFIWGMGGENKDYTDMDFVDLNLLR